MERLTLMDDKGWYIEDQSIAYDEKRRGEDVDRLAAYEDTGLTPEEILSADVAPVRHGRWILEVKKGSCIDFHVKAHCSECGREWRSKDGVGDYSYVFSAFVHGPDENAIWFVLNEARKIKIDNYCSNCGAKMEEMDEEESE